MGWPRLVAVVLTSWSVLIMAATSVDHNNGCPVSYAIPAACKCGEQAVNGTKLWTVECTQLEKPHDASFLRYVPLFAEGLILKNITFVEDPLSDSFVLTSAENNQIFERLKYLKMENVDMMQQVPLSTIFCSFPNLERAELANNTLLTATFNASCMSKLKYLDLRNNHIRYILNSSLEELDKTDGLTIDLRGNTFSCDCNIAPLMKWMVNATLNLVEPQTYTCMDGFPEDVGGHRMMEVNPEFLLCQPSPEHIDPIVQDWVHHHANFGYFLYSVLGFLLVLAFAVLAFGLYANFGHMVKCVGEVNKAPVMQRRHYSTLDIETPA